MGARAQVHIKDTGVYLYTHWGASHIFDDVVTAISQQIRWDDPEYLARIIFDCMKGTEVTGELGYGIGTSKHGDIERLVIVDCSAKHVEFIEVYEPSTAWFSFSEVAQASTWEDLQVEV